MIQWVCVRSELLQYDLVHEQITKQPLIGNRETEQWGTTEILKLRALVRTRETNRDRYNTNVSRCYRDETGSLCYSMRLPDTRKEQKLNRHINERTVKKSFNFLFFCR
jgi:hypothetical protein